MKKILVAFDGSYYSESALHYAVQLAESSGALISGLFLEDITAFHQFSPVFYAPEMVGVADDVITELQKENRQNLKENIEKFSEACRKAGVNFSVESESGIPGKALVGESRFADLLIIGYVTYFSNISPIEDPSLLSDVLTNSLCPVMVVPEKAYDIHTIIFTYNGTDSSIAAIRSCLLAFSGQLKKMKTIMLTIEKKSHEEPEGSENMLQYLKLYAPDCRYEELTGSPAEEILHYAEVNDNSLVVMGAYAKGAFAKIFKPSVGERIIRNRSVPVLVAHK